MQLLLCAQLRTLRFALSQFLARNLEPHADLDVHDMTLLDTSEITQVFERILTHHKDSFLRQCHVFRHFSKCRFLSFQFRRSEEGWEPLYQLAREESTGWKASRRRVRSNLSESGFLIKSQLLSQPTWCGKILRCIFQFRRLRHR